jgi:hypothetical protein
VVIERYRVILTPLLLLPAALAAADNQCPDQTCVDVFTENNQLIILASKNGVKPTPAPRKKLVVRPTPAASKRSSAKPSGVPIVKKVAAKPKPKRSAIKKLATDSLSD